MEKGRAESVKMSRASLTGRISEQLAPFLPDFEYDPTEARFIGSPVDFVVFKGLSGHNVEEVIFVEVKSGAASLTQTERSLRDAIKARRVSWEEYHAPLPTAET
ncbi:MAG: hypothetical protein KGH72_03750 [Candidatus Micrarchaeota archaeon]|nr:hypothetical protein [Candidatus Micrarchaeota archaeon]